jgi:hypothetical protein
MTHKNTNRPLFKPDTEAVLTRGLNAMTVACDSLTKRNEELMSEVKALNAAMVRLKERILTESGDKE